MLMRKPMLFSCSMETIVGSVVAGLSCEVATMVGSKTWRVLDAKFLCVSATVACRVDDDAIDTLCVGSCLTWKSRVSSSAPTCPLRKVGRKIVNDTPSAWRPAPTRNRQQCKIGIVASCYPSLYEQPDDLALWSSLWSQLMLVLQVRCLTEGVFALLG